MDVTTKARIGYDEIINNRPTKVHIPHTKKIVKLYGMKPYTIERLTSLWVERDANTIPDNAPETLKSLCIEPYFAIKEAVLMVLNSWMKIHLFYGFMWRWWAYFKGYTDEQMMPIIEVGKKKLPLSAHWTIMAFSVDMRMDWMKMTKKEAEEYRAELLSVQNALSLRNSQSMEGQEDSSLGL